MGLRNKTSEVIDSLLFTVALSGMVGLCIVAPTSLVALEKPLVRLLTSRTKKRDAKRIARYLKQQKLVKVTDNYDGSYQVALGDKGVARANRVQFERLEIPQRAWDKKWRIIMSDIPEQYKTNRDYISRHLRIIGFMQLQRSVFVYPYPVDDFVALLRELFPEIDRHVIYLTVEDIDKHNSLVRSFKNILR